MAADAAPAAATSKNGCRFVRSFSHADSIKAHALTSLLVFCNRNVFSRHHRKARLLFGLSDLLITALAFEAAYQTRRLAPFLEHDFYLQRPVKALLLGTAVVAWVVLGYWLDLYDRLDSAHPRIILRDTFRQCAIGFVGLVLLEY